MPNKDDFRYLKTGNTIKHGLCNLWFLHQQVSFFMILPTSQQCVITDIPLKQIKITESPPGLILTLFHPSEDRNFCIRHT